MSVDGFRTAEEKARYDANAPTEAEIEKTLEGSESLRGGSAPAFPMVPNEFYRNPKFSADAKLLYTLIVGYVGRNDFAWPGQDALCEAMDVSKNTLRAAMSQLVESGLVKVTRRGFGKQNLYFAYDFYIKENRVKNKKYFYTRSSEFEHSDVQILNITEAQNLNTKYIQGEVDTGEADADIYTHDVTPAQENNSHPLKAKPVNVKVPALAQEKKSVSDAVVAKNTGHGKGAYSLFPEFKGMKTPAQRERQSPGESIAEYKNMEPIHPSKNALRWYTQRFVQNFDCLPEVGNFPAAASRLKDLVTRHGAEVCERALTRFFADEKQRVRGYGWNNFVTCFESYRFEKGASDSRSYANHGGGGNDKQTPMDKMYQAVDRINVIKNRGEL